MQQVSEFDPIYPHVRIEYEKEKDFPYVLATTDRLIEGGATRQHKRIIANLGVEIAGHPLVYCDEYSTAKGYETYVYARHRVTSGEFLLKLDFFLEANSTKFSELIGRSFRCAALIGEEFMELDLTTPFTLSLKPEQQQIKFLRLSIPFGDISVEFAQSSIISSTELRFAKRKVLSRKVESPLFGFAASKSTIWAPFLGSIHWASGIIPPGILENLIQMSAAAPVGID